MSIFTTDGSLISCKKSETKAILGNGIADTRSHGIFYRQEAID